MPIFNEPRYMADVLKWDQQEYSRDTGTVATGSGKLEIGTVLGKNEDGEYTPVDPQATTGEQIASAILLENIDTTDADVDNVLLLRRHAIVADGALIFADDITAEERATAIDELESIGIVARMEV